MVSSFDSLFDTMLGDWGLLPSRMPAVDITETEAAYVLEAELPGYKQEDVKVSVEKHVLKLSSTKQSSKGRRTRSVWYRRLLPCFERSHPFPEDVNSRR